MITLKNDQKQYLYESIIYHPYYRSHVSLTQVEKYFSQNPLQNIIIIDGNQSGQFIFLLKAPHEPIFKKHFGITYEQKQWVLRNGGETLFRHINDLLNYLIKRCL